MRWVAIFDLDGTLTWHDTLMPFLRGYLGRHPGRLCASGVCPRAARLLPDRPRSRPVEVTVIRAVMGGDTARRHRCLGGRLVRLPARGAFRPRRARRSEAHARGGRLLVLLSASPDLYVPLVGRR